MLESAEPNDTRPWTWGERLGMATFWTAWAAWLVVAAGIALFLVIKVAKFIWYL